jgi:2-C-methyl-D-erythritol 4-phosphate cytidylyltransferase
MARERVGAVLVAAGRSTRMGFDKLWAELANRPVVDWSLQAIAASRAVDRLVLVVARERLADAALLIAPYELPAMAVPGGERRRDSVAAGVGVLADCGWVLVHDGARPFLTPELVRRGLDAARGTGAAVAAVPVRDTIKRVRGSVVVQTLARAELWAVQTPQVFRRDLLRDALGASDEDVTDEATLVERCGGTVHVFPGDGSNLKITMPEDLELARALIERRTRGPTA